MVRAKLVKIGNSRGLRLAKPLLEPVGFSDEVEIQAAPVVLTIRPVAAPRAVYRAKLTGSLQKNEYDTSSAVRPVSWAPRMATTTR